MKIGVFFGSRNPEHDVSIITGCLVAKGLKEMGHEVIPVYIGKDGVWYVDPGLRDLDFYKQKDYLQKIKSFSGFSLNLSQLGKIILERNSLFSPKKFEIELAFPAFHGQNGEDGTIQGLFELMNVPYVGCDVISSAIAMDKVSTKLFYQRFNLPTTNFKYFLKHEWLKNAEELLKDIEDGLPYPVMVKPARLGSSIGISKCRNREELVNSIEVALHYDEKVLVESAVEDLMDLTVCVIGGDEPRFSKIQQSAYSKDFFSYEDKYLNDGGAQLGNAEKSIIIPAKLDDKTTNEIQEIALQVFKHLGCKGIARVDFLYDQTYKKYYVNEINTLPGTIYHHLWKESGVELTELLKILLEEAASRHTKKQNYTLVFESAILKKSGLKIKGS